MRRVVVTGMGMVTPVGRDLESTWAALLAGRSRRRPDLAVRRPHLPDPDRRRGQGLRSRRLPRRRRPLGRALAGTPSSPWPPARWRWTTRGWTSTARPGPDPVRRLPRLRRGAAGLPPVRRRWSTRPATDTDRVDTAEFTAHGVQRPARDPRGRAGAGDARRPTWPASSAPEGPNANCLTACAASSQAIGEAVEMIRRGDADVMLSGGTHSMIHPFGVTGFNLLTALSTRNDEPDQGQPPVRPRPRRLHPRRGRRHARPRGAGARQGPRGPDLRRDRRLRLDRRRLPPHRQPRGGPRRHRLHQARPWPTPGSTPRRSTTSTPTAPARRSTTRSRPWRSSRRSATRRTRSRSPAPRA